jgi:hypothetical protein
MQSKLKEAHKEIETTSKAVNSLSSESLGEK